jgi:hypothetical protein
MGDRGMGDMGMGDRGMGEKERWKRGGEEREYSIYHILYITYHILYTSPLWSVCMLLGANVSQ